MSMYCTKGEAGLHEPIIEEFERYPAPPEVIYGKC